MGNAKIYYYPESAAGDLETIDLLEPLSDLIDSPYRLVSDGVTWGGARYRSVISGGNRVQVVLENFSSRALYRNLITLQSHLTDGGVIAVAADSAKAWAAFNTGTTIYSRGDTTIDHDGNYFYEQTPSLSAGDEITIESSMPQRRWEKSTYSSGDLTATAGTLTLQSGLVFDHTEHFMLARHSGYFLALKLPEGEMGADIVTSDHMFRWTLDMTLEVDYGYLTKLSRVRGPLNTGTPGTGANPDWLGTDDVLANSPGQNL